LVLFIVPVLYTTELVVHTSHPFIIAISIFIIGWVIQFIGHKYEKAKPAFMDDLNQLLIGPFFLMAELYFILGLEKD
ncbi:Mpo1-like protein, partial [Psychrobacter sp. HY3-MNA-CIBAN-0198]